jgi:hypothetical protein
MPKKPKPAIKNMGASVRSRLLNLSKQRRQPFQLVLTYYVLERLLYRLSQTKHHDRFILKGAILLTKWFVEASGNGDAGTRQQSDEVRCLGLVAYLRI